MTDPYVPPSSEPETEQPPPSDDLGMSERGIGIFALIAGSVFTYLGYVSPISSVLNRESSVSFSMTCAGITPLVLALGFVYTLLGDRASRYLGQRNAPSVGGWIFYCFFFAVGLACFFALKAFIQSRGYDV